MCLSVQLFRISLVTGMASGDCPRAFFQHWENALILCLPVPCDCCCFWQIFLTQTCPLTVQTVLPSQLPAAGPKGRAASVNGDTPPRRDVLLGALRPLVPPCCAEETSAWWPCRLAFAAVLPGRLLFLPLCQGCGRNSAGFCLAAPGESWLQLLADLRSPVAQSSVRELPCEPVWPVPHSTGRGGGPSSPPQHRLPPQQVPGRELESCRTLRRWWKENEGPLNIPLSNHVLVDFVFYGWLWWAELNVLPFRKKRMTFS